jgi:hypothetical protein
VRILYMSGYTDDAVIQRRVHTPGVGFIAKPFNGREILEKIQQLLDD